MPFISGLCGEMWYRRKQEINEVLPNGLTGMSLTAEGKRSDPQRDIQMYDSISMKSKNGAK